MTLTLAIIGHLVGDYLLQNDWMALNKKKRSLNCAAGWIVREGTCRGAPLVSELRDSTTKLK